MSTLANSPPLPPAPPPAAPFVPSVVTLVVHFVNSIKEVLRTMTRITVTVGKPIQKQTPLTTYDVSAIIGFSGGFVGSMVLSFPSATAQAVVDSFAGAPIDPASADFSDAVGELANMIAGSAKASFGSAANISVPSVILGPGHTVARVQGVPCLVVPCRTSAGEFAVEINIKPQIEAPPAPRS